ncbi:scinderin like a [Genypterus blacodes]|uniref:scinderin like a n=1 Tax=Genypterus blacodes TaxID=154954 RepID=UPI003F7684DC
MASHKEFQTAGKVKGLQVWRIEKMDIKPVAKEQHGIFYNEDAYIVLHTASAQSHDIHIWLGEKCSQDEMCAAAILACQLDNFLGGSPKQVREVQNYESLDFQGYFKSGIRYKKGGVSSGFTHVVTNDTNEPRLLHVKGRRHIRANEVDMTWQSFNKGDCFIIDLGESIYIWYGSECSGWERLKASELAIDIRDNERQGRIKMHMVDEDDGEPEVIIKVLGPKPANLPSSSSITDKEADQANQRMACLYMVSDADGSMKINLVAEKNPFQQDVLSPKECYILDNHGDNMIIVWKGSSASMSERSTAINMADEFIKKKNYPKHTQVHILGQWHESTLFKQFFFNWQDKDETTGPTKAYTIGSIAKVEQVPFDASKLHSDKIMAAQHGMVDDGSGKVKIWRVEGGDKVLVDPSKYGQFFGGDCYLVLYTYSDGGREKHIIYTWQGLKCSKDELGGSAFITVQLDESMGGSPVQVIVTQGQEPPHLVSLFSGNPLVIYLGGTSREGGQSQPKSTQLFHIRRSSTKATRAVEVGPSADSLNTNDVFVLKTPDSLFQWKGKGATDEEIEAAKYVASLLGGTVTAVDESKEPNGFWTALGGKKPYQTSKSLMNAVHLPRLFGCSNKTGVLRADEVSSAFTQMDLATDDVMLLDTWEQLFLWIGKEANEVEKKGSQKIAADYLTSDPAGRSSIPINIIKQGEEPLSFIGWFQAWDSTMWDKSVLERIEALI